MRHGVPRAPAATLPAHEVLKASAPEAVERSCAIIRDTQVCQEKPMPDATTAAPSKAAADREATAAAPLIVDLGKHARKDIKRLRGGRGKLLAEITTCIDELKQAGTVAANAQPIVILVREKRRKSALWPLA
jgi:ribosomal protein L13E